MIDSNKSVLSEGNRCFGLNTQFEDVKTIDDDINKYNDVQNMIINKIKQLSEIRFKIKDNNINNLNRNPGTTTQDSFRYNMQNASYSESQNTSVNHSRFLTQCLTNEFQFVQVVLNECN